MSQSSELGTSSGGSRIRNNRFQKLRYSYKSVITSITLRLMGVSLSLMIFYVSIGAFLRNTLIFRRRILNGF